jgi:hypothetical protein
MASTPQQPVAMDDSLRQALAVAIVRSKRRCTAEAAEWRAKAARLEAQLQEQRQQHAQLHAWATSLVPDAAAHAQGAAAGSGSPEQPRGSNRLFLPPLALAAPSSSQPRPQGLQLQGSYQRLQHQLLVSAAATAHGSAATEVLQGKALGLSSMLLENVKMTRLLHAPAGAGGGQGSSSFAQGSSAAAVADTSDFIMTTLLHVPRSSLSAAYMRQCAALLAAILAQQGSGTARPAAGATCAMTPHNTSQQLGHAPYKRPEALAVQVVGLLQQLLREQAAGVELLSCLSARPAPAGACATTAAATAMLQQMSALPSTALLLTLAVAQHLAQLVQVQQEAHTCMAGASLSAMLSTNGVKWLEQAAAASVAAFQASGPLLDELVREAVSHSGCGGLC